MISCVDAGYKIRTSPILESRNTMYLSNYTIFPEPPFTNPPPQLELADPASYIRRGMAFVRG